MTTKRSLILVAGISTVLLVGVGCDSREERVQKAINDGRENVAEQQRESAEKVAEAQREVEEARREAARETAEARGALQNSGSAPMNHSAGVHNNLPTAGSATKAELDAAREVEEKQQKLLETQVEERGKVREEALDAKEDIQEEIND